jgi:two-component system sensor histidine kinase VanS
MSEQTVDRAPGLSVRLKLTLSYAGFVMLAGALLLAAAWVFLTRTPHFGLIIIPEYQLAVLREFAPTAAIVLAFLLVFGLVGGWLLAGRMLAPLTRITDATRIVATGSLAHRIRLEGRRDEFRELADAFDAMLARLEAHVAEQQRFAANASHELRTPLAVTQTLLDVASKDRHRDNGELVGRLHALNTRAIDLIEALLMLSAIVHNLPEQGTVWVTTSAHPKSVMLTVENTGEKLTPQVASTFAEPFQRGSKRIRNDHAGVGLGLAIVNSITQAHDGTLTLAPRAAGGLCVTVQLPASPPHLTDDDH